MDLEFDEVVRLVVASHLNVAYRWGGDDPFEGFDCSGVTQDILQSLGEDPPGDQTAQDLYNHFRAHGRFTEPRLAALAFYGSSDRAIVHVGFCLSHAFMLEAGGGGRSTISPEAAAKENAWIRIRPIWRRQDLVAVIRPQYRLEMA